MKSQPVDSSSRRSGRLVEEEGSVDLSGKYVTRFLGADWLRLLMLFVWSICAEEW